MKPHTEELPDLPFDPTSISDGQLMELYSTYTSWQNYLATKLNKLEFEAERAEQQVIQAKAKAWGSLNGSATDKRVTVEGDGSVVTASWDFSNAKSNVKLVKSEMDAAERSANLMSRELSRRIGRRDQRWNA